MRSLMITLALLCCAPLTRAHAEDSCGPQGLCWPKIERGAKGPRVVALQYLLRTRGYKVVPDGKFAFATESAVRKFQTKSHLRVDGKIGWQSWEALTPNLKRGARGDAVRALQILLDFSDYKTARDGVFGNATQRALSKLQTDIEGVAIIRARGEAHQVEWCYASGGHLDGE